MMWQASFARRDCHIASPCLRGIIRVVSAISGSTRTPLTLTGIVERVTFHTEETGYGVLKVKPDRGGELITVVG